MVSDAKVEGWVDKAVSNVEKWGLQDPATLGVCIAEELGEVAEELDIVMEHHESNQTVVRLNDEVAYHGLVMQAELEKAYEDADGTPVDDQPEAAFRPMAPSEASHLQDEVDDLAALVIQLQMAVDEMERHE